MKIQRIFLSAFLAASCVFLSDYIEAEESHSSAVTKQKPVVEVTIRNNTKSVKTNQKKSTSVAGKNDLAKQSGPQKPLNLSITHAYVEESGPLTGQNTGIQAKETNIFAGEKKMTRPMQLNGRLLTSQEPEVEKQKLTEGVGIVINIKP
ncbi:hypothetical protein [Methylomicrobium lacus]|uniref:hypothetical protein n=1 Tax=Methylomicrobium lacus TaxID=136992 RepID=UPI00045E985D|nr:hypothetical protein [Methylomicrobium lacus]